MALTEEQSLTKLATTHKLAQTNEKCLNDIPYGHLDKRSAISFGHTAEKKIGALKGGEDPGLVGGVVEFLGIPEHRKRLKDGHRMDEPFS